LRAARRVLDPGAVKLAAVIAVAAALVAGCELAADEDNALGGDDSADPGAPPPAACVTADDCALASTTCCGCGEYGVSADSRGDACDEVECPPPAPGECPALIAACVNGACAAACAPVVCELSCANGFAADAYGCLTCACAEAPPASAECSEDVECAQVAADCCGCARGGADTAVPASEADAFSESLMCPDRPACPEVDVCDPSVAPRCRGGRCVLEGDPDDGAGEAAPTCGRPDLPTCPEGTVCVLNADSAASMDGVGSCQVP
jgi:hypothetical protein